MFVVRTCLCMSHRRRSLLRKRFSSAQEALLASEEVNNEEDINEDNDCLLNTHYDEVYLYMYVFSSWSLNIHLCICTSPLSNVVCVIVYIVEPLIRIPLGQIKIVRFHVYPQKDMPCIAFTFSLSMAWLTRACSLADETGER